MNKAVLVIDMPNTCYDCPLNNYGDCIIVGDVDEDLFNDTRDSNCPLKSLPEKKETSYQSDTLNVRIQWQGNTFREGWNACLTELMEKENESDR